MKLNLKMIAAAAAMVALTGGAKAAIVTQGQSGTLVLAAFNTVTGDYYLRDLGFTMSSFLPTGALNSVGEIGSPIVGDKTPSGGLNLNAGNTANFGDASFSSWFVSQTAADVRWLVSAVDTIGSTATGVTRVITSSANLAESAVNSNVTNYVASGNAGGLEVAFGPASTISVTAASVGLGILADSQWAANWGFGTDSPSLVGESAGLFYFTRTVPTGSTSAVANGGAYRAGTNFASVTLAANGDFSYVLGGAPVGEVPLPAAAWLLGAGLLGLGGAARRRKAAAAAV